MKANFKPLALASAVAAASVGYTGVTQAHAEFAGNNLGDAAIVPYYSVQQGFVSGIHIINTSLDTQVVKLRYRRAKDSMDALDFNIIMSPLDEWTGNIAATENGGIRVKTNDTSCTAPILTNGIAPMGDIFREGAEEGYIEVIGMASIDATSPMGLASKHTSAGVPLDCGAVESNFFRQATTAPLAPVLSGINNNGVYSSDVTVQTCTDIIQGILTPATPNCLVGNSGNDYQNTYADTGNVLKVSYFIRDENSGLEFGSNAIHIKNLADGPMMSNQEIIVRGTQDFYSFLFPDLDGGSPAVDNGAGRGSFNSVRSALGSVAVLNDWSVNTTTNTATDWVVTMPGQYLMLNLPVYTDYDAGLIQNCYNEGQATNANSSLPAGASPFPVCDARDIPVTVTIAFLDREEQGVVGPDSGLVISPQTTDRPDAARLPYEVNVIEWTEGSITPILESDYATNLNVAALGAPNGWATLAVQSDNTPGKKLGIVDYTQVGGTTPSLDPFDYDVQGAVPIVGFVAWERSFPEDPSANYGRIIDHSFISSN